MSEHTIRIKNGHLQFIYSDELVSLLELGEATVTRASHVEPANQVHIETQFRPIRPGSDHVEAVRVMAGTRGWVADMRPSGGSVLKAADGEGFETRAEALDAERAWLKAEKGL